MICFASLICVSMSGCLSLQFGGKSHHAVITPDAEIRIAQLEQRMQSLERLAGIPPRHTGAFAVNTTQPVPLVSQ